MLRPWFLGLAKIVPEITLFIFLLAVSLWLSLPLLALPAAARAEVVVAVAHDV